MATSVYTSQLVKDYKRKSGEIKALRKELRETSKVVLAKEAEGKNFYVVHIVPLPIIEEEGGMQYTTVGGSFRIFVDKKTGAITKSIVDQ